MDQAVTALYSNGVPTSGAAFDVLATEYDQKFTESLIGRAQRCAVWKILIHTFKANDNILELNCGTGKDAVFMARRGISVFACDASQQMIFKAEQRLYRQSSFLPVVFCYLPTERIDELHPEKLFDGIFSNFSGLNCIQDLSAVASSLSKLVKPEGQLLLCFSTRYCLIEIVYYLMRGRWGKAWRRCTGHTVAMFANQPLPVYYPTLGQIRNCLAPHFSMNSYRGIGVAVPPSYCESWARRHPVIFRILCRLEEILATVPILRTTGDHVLLCFKKVSK